MSFPPRLAPELPLPPYTYVPGLGPHPQSDPAGHSYGKARENPAPLDPANWNQSPTYLYGLDLFNHGYYWEAHEAWEGLWHAAGRAGRLADFLKGLIHLAAAGVKVRQGRPDGVRSHAARALQLLAKTARSLRPDSPRFLGLKLRDLIALAEEVKPSENPFSPGQGVKPVFRQFLLPKIHTRRFPEISSFT